MLCWARRLGYVKARGAEEPDSVTVFQLTKKAGHTLTGRMYPVL